MTSPGSIANPRATVRFVFGTIGRNVIRLGVGCGFLVVGPPAPGYASDPLVATATAEEATRDAPPPLATVADRLLEAAAAPKSEPVAPEFGRQLLETARLAARQGELEISLRLSIAAAEHYVSAPDPAAAETIRGRTAARLGISSAAWQLGRHEQVIAAADALLQDSSGGLDTARRLAVWQLLIKSLGHDGDLARSLAETRRLNDAYAGQAERFVGDQTLALGAAGLRARQPTVALDAYRTYLDLTPSGPRVADAELGAAWAAANGAVPPRQAEQQLADFLKRYPDHHDAPYVIAARAKLLDSLGDAERATEARIRLASEYGSSTAVESVLDDWILGATEATLPEPIGKAWLNRLAAITANRRQPSEATASPIPLAVWRGLFVTALSSGHDDLWQATRDALLVVDRDGDLTITILDALSGEGDEATVSGDDAADGTQHSHVAQHLAIELLGLIVDHEGGSAPSSDPASPGTGLPPACESACRWAGLTNRWTLLTLVADQVAPPELEVSELTPLRGVTIDRLLAESLMQTRRGQEATAWWAAILDVWDCDDFPTRLRGAETAVAHAEIDVARRRLAAAHEVAEDEFSLSLVQMLEAELAIRAARLDEARDRLSAVVRGTETAAELRPRAQWMIGETYFLQERYADAIDAYRRVDNLDADGDWAAAALLQAGKSFERLNRPRDAATCYSALLSRFAHLPHADPARARLAQLRGDDTLRR